MKSVCCVCTDALAGVVVCADSGGAVSVRAGGRGVRGGQFEVDLRQ